MRVLGFPIESPQTLVNRALSDIAAVARLARTVPAQFERMLTLGEEMVAIGHGVLDIAERLDRRAESVLSIGERLDARASELVDLGSQMQKLGEQVDARGAELVAGATRVAETGSDLIGVLPALERALEMASPLEGAIDRFGRLVDRLPGGAARRPGGSPTAGATVDPAGSETPGADAR
jgi:hypothetical protein